MFKEKTQTQENPVLDSILLARNERSFLRRQIALDEKPSVSFNLNIPGFPKSNDITSIFFGLCLEQLKLYLQAHLINFDDKKSVSRTDFAGEFFIGAINFRSLEIYQVKEICEQFENQHALGRFLDVDVTDSKGLAVSSGKAKPCFFCGQKPAISCMREKAHPQEDLRRYMFAEMAKWNRQQFERQICKKLASFALQSILFEISLTPKPGLVDKSGSGCHKDMDYTSFLASSAAISAYFEDIAREGFKFQNQDWSTALPIIRKIGLEMEVAMFQATNGVNTQKGIVFLMGIALFAAAHSFANDNNFQDLNFQGIVKLIGNKLVEKELTESKQQAKTHGEKMFSKYGLGGARAEAENGFPMVFRFGLPVLQKYGNLSDMALRKAFLAIASQNSDTNILHRSSSKVLQEFKFLAYRAYLSESTAEYQELIEFCQKENISPGGTADLLAISVFIYLINNQFKT
jgi:holo-ACP synthase / triphosphoribosyl-dephospho-CoA synthase